MNRRTIWITTGAAAAALVLGGTAIAFAATEGFSTRSAAESSDDGSSGDESTHLTGSDLEAAGAAALDATGPGTVVEAETGDDGTSAYEVEVRLDAGGTVEVRLDADFGVIDVEGDDSGSDDDGSSHSGGSDDDESESD